MPVVNVFRLIMNATVIFISLVSVYGYLKSTCDSTMVKLLIAVLELAIVVAEGLNIVSYAFGVL